jgi:hypothetical protein
LTQGIILDANGNDSGERRSPGRRTMKTMSKGKRFRIRRSRLVASAPSGGAIYEGVGDLCSRIFLTSTARIGLCRGWMLQIGMELNRHPRRWFRIYRAKAWYGFPCRSRSQPPRLGPDGQPKSFRVASMWPVQEALLNEQTLATPTFIGVSFRVSVNLENLSSADRTKIPMLSHQA